MVGGGGVMVVCVCARVRVSMSMHACTHFHLSIYTCLWSQHCDPDSVSNIANFEGTNPTQAVSDFYLVHSVLGRSESNSNLLDMLFA